MNNTIIQRIKNDIEISGAIKEAAFETPHLPWGVTDIADLVSDQLGIDLDTDDTVLFGELLTHFNDAQQRVFIEIVQNDKTLRQHMADIAYEMATVDGKAPHYDIDAVCKTINHALRTEITATYPGINELTHWCNERFKMMAQPHLTKHKTFDLNVITLSEVNALLQELKLQCYLNTTLVLKDDEPLDRNVAPGFVAYKHGNVVFSAAINTKRPSPCITLTCYGGEQPFTVHSTSLQSIQDTLKDVIAEYRYILPPAEEFTTITLNVPDWFADPDFAAWLDHQDQNCFTYHRHGCKIGEYSDVLVLVDGIEGDASDMPEIYWRQVVQAAHAYRARGVRLTNLSA